MNISGILWNYAGAVCDLRKSKKKPILNKEGDVQKYVSMAN